MNFSNKAAGLVKALCASSILLTSINACTEVDDQLGGSLLPNNQQMTLRIETLEGVETYLYKEDSIRSSRLGYVFFGQEKNDIFGSRKNSFVVQFLPTSLPYTEGYGLRPIVDSLVITLPLNSVHGKTDAKQEFDVYEITWDEDTQDPISKDSTYYVNFPIEKYKGKKLFTFEHSGKKDLKTRLLPTDDGKAYMKEIVNEKMEIYKDDTLFLKKYKGLYFTPAPGSEVDAAVYSSSLDNTTAYMTIYARNHDTVDVSAIYDTVAATFSFYDQTLNNIDYGNTSINIVEFDYDGSELADLYDKDKGQFTDEIQKKMYVQPMGGVAGKLKFTDELIETLRNLRNQREENEEGVEEDVYYPGIMINQAEMYIWLSTPQDDPEYIDVLDNSMKRLGSYLELKSMSGTPDYLYYTEAYRQANGESSYTLPYNGYLNRSNGYYKLDITSYIQQLAKKVEEGEEPAISPEVYLAPDAYSFFNFGESVLLGHDNESDKPIEIRITYTLIKGKKE